MPRRLDIISGSGPYSPVATLTPPSLTVAVASAFEYASSHLACWSGLAFCQVATAAPRAVLLKLARCKGWITKTFAESTGIRTPNHFCGAIGPQFWPGPTELYGAP